MQFFTISAPLARKGFILEYLECFEIGDAEYDVES